ncbi:MAG: hypothetical protein HY657_07025 [Acidobacteria bacterium]|nr:hypothetical protein [Acidobacteriota bacterium]
MTFVSGDDPQFTGGKRLSMECTVQDTPSYTPDEMNALGIVAKGAMCTGDLYDAYARILKK